MRVALCQALVGIAAGVMMAVAPSLAFAKDLSPAQQRAQLMDGVKSWGYQLQRLDIPALAASPFDLLVIDHAPDRVESVELLFRRNELEPLKVKPNGSRRLLLAYVSIGEAERYRYYWDENWLAGSSCPSWLGPVNPQWVGNYPVEYWQPAWQSIIFGQTDSYLDRVLAAGFDGIYLDRADVYEQFKDRPAAKAEMIAFLARLMDHARALKPDAVFVLQNAEELLREKGVRDRIDGAAKESLYFNADAAASATPNEDRNSVKADLRIAKKAGRKVMVVEYLDDSAKGLAARKQAEKDGFLIHFAERTLSVLNDSDLPRPASELLRPIVRANNDPQVSRSRPCG